MSDNKGGKKTKGVRFLLAPRPQRDPLAADFEAPQHVLVPKDGTDIEEIKQRLPDFDPKVFISKEETKKGMLERAHNADGLTFDSDILTAMSKDFDFDDPNNLLDDNFMDQAGGLIEEDGEILDDEMNDMVDELFEEEPEIITFDQETAVLDDEGADSDEFDIDQESHKKEINEKSETETTSNIGMGKKLILFKKKVSTRDASKPSKFFPSASQQLQEELNAQFKPENQLRLAAQNKSDDNESDVDKSEDSEGEYSEDDDYNGDTKSVFTNFSMTSSVMRRSEGLQKIDEHFERLYEKEYADDTEIGPLDLNEVKGEELLTNIDQIRQLKREVKIARKRNHGDDYEPEIVSDHYKNAIIGDDPAADEEDLVEVVFRRRENRVDCESILSYNSNLYNHPKLIVEPRRRTESNAKSDKMDVDNASVRSRSDIAQSMASTRASVLSKLSIKPPNETPEARRARKKALKAYRHERRQERKQNQQIFKSERANLVKQQQTNKPALKLA